MFVGNKAGELLVVHLPSRSVVVRSAVHPGPVERVAVTYTQVFTLPLCPCVLLYDARQWRRSCTHAHTQPYAAL